MTTVLISAESSAGSCPSCTVRRTVRTAPAASRSNKWADLNWVQISDQNISLVTHTLCWPFKSKGTLRKQTLFSDLFVEWSLELDQNCLWKPTHNHSVSSRWNQDFFFLGNMDLLCIYSKAILYYCISEIFRLWIDVTNIST